MNRSNYGIWSKDSAGLPCFNLKPEAGPDRDSPMRHLMGTGRLSALADRWGGLRLFTTDGGNGFVPLHPASSRCRSAFYSTLILDGEPFSLFPADLDTGRRTEYGTGYVMHSGTLSRGKWRAGFEQTIWAPFDMGRGLLCKVRLTNTGKGMLDAGWRVSSDQAQFRVEEEPSVNDVKLGDGFALARWPAKEIGWIGLVGPAGWAGERAFHQLRLQRRIRLAPGRSVEAVFWLGYGATADLTAIRQSISRNTFRRSRQEWKRLLAPVSSMNVPEKWIHDECEWSYGQLLSFTNVDGAVGEFYTSLGGYGWGGFCVRECGETAMALAPWHPGLARSSLRWLAKLQYSNGDLRKAHDFRRPPRQIATEPHESDGEIWFLLGCLESAAESGCTDMLEEVVPFADDGRATIWEHCRRAYRWIRDGVGTGRHGLVKIWHGDWNDYLSSVGRLGQGESVMNSGMACRAFSLLAEAARKRGDRVLAADVESALAALRAAVAKAFDRTHFLYGYDDYGKPLGGHAEDRVHLNAQTWAALGGCGTAVQRRLALRHAVRKCWSPIGLMLMSRPYSSPPPETISWCPIPPGEGENSGIWPQTVYWAVWALTEAGLRADAVRVWRAMSLRSHSFHHPDVPYGIFNGPDCYSSRHAGVRDGRTQIELSNRAAHVPMNPAIAWQAFAWRKVLAGARC